VTGQATTRSPKQIRDAAILALNGGRLHPDRWAEVDDLVLDERRDEASDLLAQQIRPGPAYSAVPGPRELVHA
jgi:hypothetical protein